MSNKEKTPAEALRDRFREELRKPVGERYFSEEEIVNVFDTSGDANDDYLRLEALMLGARLYPDSQQLLERRAIYYLDTDQDMFIKFMKDNADVSTNLMNVLRLNLLDTCKHDKILKTVESFMANHRFVEDEEVIQFVQALHTLGLDKWLADNLDRLKEKVPYLPSLLYEYAVIAEESGELAEVGIKALEELTELEPYVADYWTMMSLAYIRNDRMDDAATSIEYALAIEPDNYNALKTRLHIAHIANDTQKFNEIVGRMTELEPDDSELAVMGLMRIDSKNRQELHDYIDRLSPVARANPSVLLRAINAEYPHLSQLLIDFFENGDWNDQELIEIADYAYETGNLNAVNDILRAYEEHTGRTLDHDFLIFRIMFDMGNYTLATKIFTEAEQGGTLRRAENLYAGYSMFLIALLRSDEVESARNAAKSLLDMLDGEPDMVGSRLEQQAMRAHLIDIIRRIESRKATDWNKFEPIV